MSARSQITVDVVSDVVCPWCFIGPEAAGQGHFPPCPTSISRCIGGRFQLDPTVPPGGQGPQGLHARKVWQRRADSPDFTPISSRWAKPKASPSTSRCDQGRAEHARCPPPDPLGRRSRRNHTRKRRQAPVSIVFRAGRQCRRSGGSGRKRRAKSGMDAAVVETLACLRCRPRSRPDRGGDGRRAWA